MGDEGDQADAVRAEAAEWFARLKTVPVSRGTLEEFFAWRRIDGHGAAFEALERFWEASSAAADRPGIQAAMEAALSRGHRRRWSAGRLGVIAALFCGLVLAGLAALLVLPARGHLYATAVGQRSIITLDDGTTVTLDTDTSLRVHYDATARRVTLDHGRAFFAVAHAVDRPFTVAAGGIEVLATGTRFDVQLGPSTQVTLVEGSVRVGQGGRSQPVQLRAGQQVRLGPAEPPVVRSVDAAAQTAWTHGRIVFDQVRLLDAVGEVNRYTLHPIRLDADRYAGDRLSGSFDTGDVAGFVAAATAILPIKAVRQPDGTTTLADTDVKNAQ